jgi:hypothetical protein
MFILLDDTVYMPQTELLDEYILNESGAVWRGNYTQPGAKEWNFGQVFCMAFFLFSQ